MSRRTRPRRLQSLAIPAQLLRMRLRQIEIFFHVYRCGSISGAARDLNVSQPSVSKVLKHLEDQLGFDLFKRDKGRLIPTDAAHELFADVDRINDEVGALRRTAANIRNRRGGHLRLGLLPSLSLSVGPELIARMRQKDADLTFELTTLHTPEIAPSLLEKRTDLCIGFEPVLDERVTSCQIGDGAIVLVSGEPVARKQPIDAHILHDCNFIGMRESGPLANLISRTLANLEVMPNEIVTTHTYHVALSLVRKRLGIAVTDQYTAFSHLGSGLHRHILHDFPRIPIIASTLKEHPEPKILERSVKTLGQVLSEFDETIPSLATPLA